MVNPLVTFFLLNTKDRNTVAEAINTPWHHPKKRWQLTCYSVRIDCRINKILSTKCPNQGLLIDGTVDITLSKFCQLGHIYSCSGEASYRLSITTSSSKVTSAEQALQRRSSN